MPICIGSGIRDSLIKYNTKSNLLTMKKTVFITGANKGIGYGIAKHLGLSGWSIVLGARNEERAEKAIKELK